MKKLKLLFLSCSIVLLIIGFSCQKYDSDSISEKVTESVELEEYILSGLDFQHSLNEFNKELKSIDMLSIKPTLDARGNVVMIIPTKISIENKSKVFNQKKKALLEKYPELKKLRSEKRQDVIKERTDNSLKITKVLMDFEYITDQPRVRSNPSEYFFSYFSDQAEAYTYLDQQIASSSYVEVALAMFEDGSYRSIISDINTSTNCWTNIGKNNDKFYLHDENNQRVSNSPIVWVAHTHRDLSPPSSEDIDNKIEGLDMRIYYSGGTFDYY